MLAVMPSGRNDTREAMIGKIRGADRRRSHCRSAIASPYVAPAFVIDCRRILLSKVS
jgi:hypothetical protein